MKKLISIFTLFAFTLYANQTPPVESSDTESSVSSPIYPIYTSPNPPVRERTDKPSSNFWKVTIAVVGILTAITLGLFVSGRNTGNHIESSEHRDFL